jgi:hypothetical protein
MKRAISSRFQLARKTRRGTGRTRPRARAPAERRTARGDIPRRRSAR